MPAAKKTTAVMNVEQRIAEQRARVKTPAGNKISLKPGAFKAPGGQEVETIAGVIVDLMYYNRYDIHPYREGDVTPPDCYAVNEDEEAMAPAEGCPEPQDSFCNSCAQNEFPDRGGSKPCRNKIRLALLPPDNPEADIMVLEVPPASLGVYRKFHARVTDSKLLAMVVAEFDMDTASKYAKIKTIVPIGPTEDWEKFDARQAEARKLISYGHTYDAAEPQKAKPKTRARATRKARRG